MEYNYSKLQGRIREKGFTQESLAAEIPMDRGVLSLKLNNKRSFRMKEIEGICRVLEIPLENVGEYFFAH